MQVYKCDTPAPKAVVEYPLSWFEILKKPGVYIPNTFPGARIVVLTEPAETVVGGVLFYHGTNLDRAYTPTWSRCKFKEVVGAKVCFEIKEGEVK